MVSALRIKMYQSGFRWLGPLFPQLASEQAIRMFFTPMPVERDDVDRDTLERANRRSLSLDGVPLQVYSWGTGPKVVCLHGWGGAATDFAAFVSPLTAAGYSVIAFDAPGHGASGKVPTNFVKMGEALKVVLKDAGEVHAVIAHSVGGAAALFVLAEIEAALVGRAVLISTPFSFYWTTKSWASMLSIPEQVFERMQSGFHRILGKPVAYYAADTLGPRIGIPLLLLHDRHDNLIPAGSSEGAAPFFSRATLAITERLGHYHILSSDHSIGRIVDFLGQP